MPSASARTEIPCAITIGVLEAVAADVAPFVVVALVATIEPAIAPAALLVEEFCARTRGREYANAAAVITAATATTLIRRKSFSVPLAPSKVAQAETYAAEEFELNPG